VPNRIVNFYQFLPKSAHFCKFLTTFYAFLPIFYQIFLAYFTQTPQTNPTAPIFRSKTTIAPKISEIYTPISPISDNFNQ